MKGNIAGAKRTFSGSNTMYGHVYKWWVIPCEKSEKKMTKFFWIFDLKSLKY